MAEPSICGDEMPDCQPYGGCAGPGGTVTALPGKTADNPRVLNIKIDTSALIEYCKQQRRASDMTAEELFTAAIEKMLNSRRNYDGDGGMHGSTYEAARASGQSGPGAVYETLIGLKLSRGLAQARGGQFHLDSWLDLACYGWLLADLHGTKPA